MAADRGALLDGGRAAVPDELWGLLAGAGCAADCLTMELRREPRAAADVRLFLVDRDGRLDERLPTLMRVLGASPSVASLRHAGRGPSTTVSIAFTDEHLLALADELDRHGPPRGLPEGAPTSSATAPSRRLVGMLGANSSKSLHLGHLRNVLVGQATAAVLRGAGLPTATYSLVGDIGRSVCEALAGHQLGLGGAGPDVGGVKPDAYAGECYRAYLARSSAGDGGGAASGDGGDGGDDPCRREYEVSSDDADQLLHRWRERDAETVAEWRRFVEAVDRGHAATLASLGITIDEWWRESAHLDEACRLVDDAVARGVARTLEDGRVVFDSSVAGFPTVVLRRSDGFPTEHARVVAVFHALFAAQPGPAVHLDYNGTEWQHAQAALTELMEALDLIPATLAHRPAIHGMVVLDGAALSSSVDEPPLVDDVLARLAAWPAVVELAGAGPDTHRAVVADVVLRTYFLATPLPKALMFSWERLLDPAANPGWAVAEAWCRAAALAEGAAASDGLGPEDRVAVLQAQTVALELAKSLDADGRVDLSHLTALLVRSARRLLAAPPGSLGARAARATLLRCLELLGFPASSRTEASTP